MRREGIIEAFDRHASELADSTAISGAGRSVTYRELREKSNSLANFLIASGAPQGALVAILAEDAAEFITAVLGVLKAGCVFVPLDPRVPEKRLRALASQVSPQWFIAESKFVPTVGRVAGEAAATARVVRVDGDGRAVAGGGDCGAVTCLGGYPGYFNPEPPRVSFDRGGMCYIYFTSGSTGQPKAIAGRLKGVEHFIRWEIKALNLGAGVRVSHLLPPTFDGSLRDIFVPLAAGGAVCVPPNREAVLDARRLIDWLDEQRVNVIHCVPSLFRSIINESNDGSRLASLRYILMAGEPLLPSDVGRWMDIYGERVQLINLYGTSETTMAKFFYFVSPADRQRRSVPIGQPMEGAAALVLDEQGRACAPGMIGEIHIRTPYATLGYYNQPRLTGEVFVPNPFSDDPHDLVHKTGDLGRILEDGNYEYLGRRDRQVKIRGVRVELGEIENLLRRHGAVKDVAVVDWEDTSRSNYLCAYIVLDGEVEIETLRAFLADELPDYMVPSTFLVMNSLPRTITGKVDRRALPVPGRSREGLRQEYVAPRTPLEEMLAGIWAELLGVERVGVHDNLFQLGGHSLRATQILSRVRTALKVEVPLRAVFEAPTVAGLAERIESAERTAEVEVPIRPLPREGRLPLSFAQQRLWFLQQLDPDNPAYNLHLGVRFSGPLQVDALERTVAEIIRRHEALRTTFALVDGEVEQVVGASLPRVITSIDLSSLREEAREHEVRRLAAEEAHRPFDLQRGPLLRVSLLRLGEREHVLLVTMHHIVSDGWSMGVMVREVAALYPAYAAGQESPLADLPIQYADYVAWQRGRLKGEALERQLDYWRRQLADAPASLHLPTDNPRPQFQSFRGGSQPLSLSRTLTESLKALSRRVEVTLYMTLLAAFLALLHRYSGQDDIVVGTPMAGRNRVETEPLIGFFVNTLALRTDLSGNPTFRQLLHRVREVALGAYMHQDVPFEKLVEELHPARSRSRQPLFQVWFVLHNAPVEPLRLSEVSLEPVEVSDQTTQFDLTLTMYETAQGLRGTLIYRTDLFETETAREMTRHFERLLEAVATHPELPLLDIPLSPDEAESYTVAAHAAPPPERMEDQFQI